MPNHVHGIILLAQRENTSGSIQSGDHKDRPYGTLPDSLGRVVQAFKSITTHEYITGVKNSDWQSFPGKLWQRNYWEHIIRDEPELHHIREYIQNNPTRWQEDALHLDQGPFPGETREPAPHYGREAWMV
jgi:REP element-mobilizing transposase RayT